MRFIAVLLAALFPVCVPASPCSGIDRKIGESERALLAPIIAKQLTRRLPLAEVGILQSFRLGRWRILYVDPRNWEPVYLFFRGDPASTDYLELWGGTAKPDEEDAVLSWTKKKVPGIPMKLAVCFAFHVSKERVK